MSDRLRELAIGVKARVRAINPTGKAYRQKLLSMGLTPGVTVEMVRVAPLGDPVEIKLRGYLLSLRKIEADALDIEVIA